MNKLALWTVGGIGLSTACGLAGLPHLSATLASLTVFYTVPALLVLALDGPPNIGKTRT